MNRKASCNLTLAIIIRAHPRNQCFKFRVFLWLNYVTVNALADFIHVPLRHFIRRVFEPLRVYSCSFVVLLNPKQR